ncbi:hypothetical protein GCM10009788_38810 [Nocardioides humi]|uniref:Uncharacterized protein n=1 Tax=Nocardioides humi TaxID=449461 RepID=A0ABN2B3F8_9ACTN
MQTHQHDCAASRQKTDLDPTVPAEDLGRYVTPVAGCVGQRVDPPTAGGELVDQVRSLSGQVVPVGESDPVGEREAPQVAQLESQQAESVGMPVRIVGLRSTHRRRLSCVRHHTGCVRGLSRSPPHAGRDDLDPSSDRSPTL